MRQLRKIWRNSNSKGNGWIAIAKNWWYPRKIIKSYGSQVSEKLESRWSFWVAYRGYWKLKTRPQALDLIKWEMSQEGKYSTKTGHYATVWSIRKSRVDHPWIFKCSGYWTLWIFQSIPPLPIKNTLSLLRKIYKSLSHTTNNAPSKLFLSLFFITGLISAIITLEND